MSNLYENLYEICGLLKQRMHRLSKERLKCIVAHRKIAIIFVVVKKQLGLPFFILSMLLSACSLLCWSQALAMSDDFLMLVRC